MIRLSGPVSKLIAWLLLFASVFAVYSFAILPVVSAYRHGNDEISTKQRLIARYEREIAESRREIAHLEDLRKSLTGTDAYITATESPLAIAELRGIVERVAREAGVRLQSSQTVPGARNADGPQAIAIRASMAMTTKQVLSVLHQLEIHRPYIFVSGLNILAPGSNQADPSKEALLRTQITVESYLKPSIASGESTNS